MAHRPRVYLNERLEVGTSATLPAANCKHLLTVLRMRSGAPLDLFNGDGKTYRSTLRVDGKKASAAVDSIEPGPPTGEPIALALGISRGDRMDYALQKCTELGVSRIVPLITDRSNVKLARDRLPKKMQHWNNILVSASEQSGRCELPELSAPTPLSALLEHESPGFVLDPSSQHPLSGQRGGSAARCVLVGPESGLSAEELNQASNVGWQAASLGPLILRTETAAVLAVAMLRVHDQLM
ncbi:MAG: 16S rRNA (uracil(1498)-N(3))-methyltransferase [Pseudomonadota bacterium]